MSTSAMIFLGAIMALVLILRPSGITGGREFSLAWLNAGGEGGRARGRAGARGGRVRRVGLVGAEAEAPARDAHGRRSSRRRATR